MTIFTIRYAHAQVDSLLWFWPQGEEPAAARHSVDDRLRFLAPFDPVVRDRRRFQSGSSVIIIRPDQL
jgi:uncharacterized protein YcaQ